MFDVNLICEINQSIDYFSPSVCFFFLYIVIFQNFVLSFYGLKFCVFVQRKFQIWGYIDTLSCMKHFYDHNDHIIVLDSPTNRLWFFFYFWSPPITRCLNCDIFNLFQLCVSDIRFTASTIACNLTGCYPCQQTINNMNCRIPRAFEWNHTRTDQTILIAYCVYLYLAFINLCMGPIKLQLWLQPLDGHRKCAIYQCFSHSDLKWLRPMVVWKHDSRRIEFLVDLTLEKNFLHASNLMTQFISV